MKYAVRINKRIKNVQVYLVSKRIGERQNPMTKLFTGIFNRKQGKEDITNQLKGGPDSR